MKILRVITRLNIGGPAQQAIELSNRIERTLLVYGKLLDNEKEMEFPDTLGGYYISTLIRNISPINDFKTFLKLRQLIKIFKPDIIHTHLSKAGALTRLAYLTIKHKAKLVHTFHGTILEGYFGRFKSWLFKIIERLLALYTNKLIAISTQQAIDIVYKYRLINYKKVWDKIQVIPLGLNLKPFDKVYRYRQKHQVTKNTISIAIIGRIVPIKNHKLFVDIIKELNKLSDKKVNGHIIGGTAEDYIKNIQKRYTNIIHWEYVEHNIVAPMLGSIDLVVCTSNNEGTPVALIEAMAAGIPVASTNVGGVIDMFDGLDTSTLLISFDASVSAKLIYNKFFRSDAKINVSIAHDKIIKKYDIIKLEKRIRNLYTELLDN